MEYIHKAVTPILNDLHVAGPSQIQNSDKIQHN